MSEQPKKIPCGIGLLAHVDAGKPTLSEALLYCSGAKRTLGRVDHRDSFLDTHDLERARGITIFSKQAILSTPSHCFTLVDTPGHVDFSAEAERTMPILDCAVLVISGSDGVQAHTVTLWKLLEKYHIPTFLFINKMDLPGTDPDKLMQQLQRQLSAHCVSFSQPDAIWQEQAALCDEGLLDVFLETGTLPDPAVRQLIQQRKLLPCCFGSALHLEGIPALLEVLDRFAPQPDYPDEFGAIVHKISHDPQGVRLTWLKITGGSLKVKSTLGYTAGKEEKCEKVQAIRLYSGDKFTLAEEVSGGTLCAVAGLSATYAGQGLGNAPSAPQPTLRPVMTYRVQPSLDAALALPKLRMLEQEEPELKLIWDDRLKQIHVQIMGRVQLEVFRDLARQRFGMELQLLDPRIFYLETIENEVEGVGHFEPLRHYAEVHILLSPLPPGSGLVFDTVCPTDVLDVNFQNLILTHMAEKAHRGVLTGAPITDMKLTLLIGRAHLKHTEGGDFRQATYRAIRQGLMQAKSRLLEPWYAFTLTLPSEQIGRAITDIRAMGGEFDAPQLVDSLSELKGLVPASELGDYAQQVAAYSQGRGRLQISLHGYLPCHNADEVIAQTGYDPESDLENTPDSVFCAHGSGFTVKWNRVREYMHLDSGIKEEKKPVLLRRNLQLDDRELEAIMEREFGPIKRPACPPPEARPTAEAVTLRPPRQQYLIVDGYNILYAWPELAALASEDLQAARRRLCDLLSSFAGYRKCRTVVVFDGYKVKGNPGEKTRFSGIEVVFTKENETADAYIEALVAQIGLNYNLRVATSDAMVQLSSLRSGVLRISARELQAEVESARREMEQYYK